MKAIKQTLLALALAGAFTNANAIPVDWTLSDVFLSTPYYQGSYAGGTFTYDADTGVFSNVKIFRILDTITQSTATSFELISSKQYNVRPVSIVFSDTLTNAGGNLTFTGRDVLPPSDSYLVGTYSGKLVGVPQTPKATAVPEPEAYAMMLAGLGLVGFAARRKLS